MIGGYHLTAIPKGVLGDASKIKEEVEEFLDAHRQGVRILELNELADLYGAIEAYVQKVHGMTIGDIAEMHEVTKRAFKLGDRR